MDDRVHMDDDEILRRIHELVDAEHRLRAEGRTGVGVPQADLQRLEETLDQCWDLLRQRRAHREFGQNADDAQLRAPEQVERYQQ